MQIRVGDWTSPDFGSFQNLVNKTMNVEAIRVEQEMGMPFEQLAKGLASGFRASVTAFVFILRKREEPTLKFDEIQFTEEDLELIVTDADKARQAQLEQEAKDELERAAARPTEQPELEDQID